MTVRLLAAAALAAAVGVAAGTRPAPAQDRKMSREQALQAFHLLLDANGHGGKGPNLLVQPPALPGVGVPDGMVKVWARRYDPDRKQPVGEPVALDAVAWQPEEYFLLQFQSTTQVYFTLHNVLKENGVTKYDMVMPNPREDLLDSFKPIPAGKEYEMPFPLVMEKHADDEEVLFGFYTQRHPIFTPPAPQPTPTPTPTPGPKRPNYIIQARDIDRQVLGRDERGGVPVNPVKRMPLFELQVSPPPRGNRPANGHDAVAKFVAIKQQGGVAQLLLKKKPGGRAGPGR